MTVLYSMLDLFAALSAQLQLPAQPRLILFGYFILLMQLLLQCKVVPRQGSYQLSLFEQLLGEKLVIILE